MRIGRIAAIILTAALTVSAVTGCGQDRDKKGAESASSALTGIDEPQPEAAAESGEESASPAAEGESAADKAEAPEQKPAAEKAGAADADAGEKTETVVSSAAASLSAALKDVSGNSSPSSVGAAPSPAADPSGSTADGEPVYVDAPGVITAKDGTTFRVCFFGDDQFDRSRGEEDSIDTLVERYLGAEVYNCAISRTTAALDASDVTDEKHWGSVSLCGMARAATGSLDPAFISAYEDAYGQFASCDMSKVDAFVLCYGMNDFRGGYPLSGLHDEDEHSYAGALNASVRRLKRSYPGAQIIIISPSYSLIYEGGNYVGDTNIYNNGIGTMSEYVLATERIAKAANADYIDAYSWLGITNANYDRFLEEGRYFNPAARRIAAQMISRLILRHNGYDVPSDVDLDKLDFGQLERTQE